MTKKTVLVVEDDPANRYLLVSILNENGYDAVESVDGSDAMALAKQHHPSLVLMDIQLPQVSGKERIRQFKADSALKHIPIIAVTTQIMKGDEDAIRASGCDEYISKPFDVEHIMRTIARLIA